MAKNITTESKPSKPSKRALKVNVNPRNETGWLFSNSDTITVDTDNALKCATVWRAANLIASTIANCPIEIYLESEDIRSKNKQHQYYNLLKYAPNSEVTAYNFWYAIELSVLLTGNGYAEIERNKLNKAIGLHFLPSCQVEVSRDNNQNLIYVYSDGAKKVPIRPENILHFLGPTINGVVGMSRIAYAANSIGLMLNQERYALKFFENAIRPSGRVTVPANTSVQAKKEIKDSLKNYAGSGNTGKVMMLPEGVQWENLSIPPEEAQFVTASKYQVEEIARWFGLKAYMLSDMQAAFSNIEAQRIDFYVSAIQPWLLSHEQELRRKLFANDNSFPEYNTEAILKMESANKIDILTKGISAGIYTINEVRKMYNLPPLPEKQNS